MTCGAEIAADAEVPEALAALMAHVAANMEAHARWVGANAAGARERDGLLTVAREYRMLAEAAERAAAAMRAMHDLPAAPHDPEGLDRVALARWMRVKIDMQHELIQLLTAHVDASGRALAELEAAGP